jgi:predicted phage terminase large subunit-like protein
MRALGVGGGITGRSMEILIVDDPVKGRVEVDRDTYRDEQWAWWPQAVDRVQEGGGIIVLCTRWHHDDLPGRLLKKAAEDLEADQWQVIKLKAIAGEDDPLGRMVGEPLAPGRHSVEWLKRMRAGIPERDWSAKYDQEPTVEGGNIFRAEWLRFEEPPAGVKGYVFQCADTAFSEKKRAAFTCVETWRIEANCVRLLHVYRQRGGFPSLNEDIRELAGTFKPIALVIEDKASGMSLIQVLHKETRLPVLPWQPKGDKATRAHAVTPMFKSGRVVLPKPENAPWVHEWVKEHLDFPASEYKDQVDTTSLGLLWVQEQGWLLEDQQTVPEYHDFSFDAKQTEDQEMTDIWSDVSGARQLRDEIQRVKRKRVPVAGEAA